MQATELLNQLITAHANTEPDQRANELNRVIVEAGVDLDDLFTQVCTTFDEVEAGDHDDDSVARLEALVDIAEAVTTALHQAQNGQRANSAAQRLAAARQAHTIHPPAGAATEDAALEQTRDSAAAPAPPPPDQGGTVEPATASVNPGAEGSDNSDARAQDQDASTSGTGAEETPPPTVPSQAAAAQSPLPQAAASNRPVPLSQLPRQRQPALTQGRVTTYSVNCADIPGLPVGAELPDLTALSQALVARMTGLARVGPGRTAQAGVATIHRHAPAGCTYVNDNDWQIVDEVCNERNLPGGNLVAAAGENGGWCAPSETLYNMCPTAEVDGLVDLPEVTTRRGGVRYPVVPDFSEIYSGTGFHFTEGQITGNPEEGVPAMDPAGKPCWTIPCTDMVDNRLDVDGLCIRTPILTERGWPELVEYFLAQALAAHAHKINAWVLARMEALSTPVTIPAPDTATGIDDHGPGATATVLSVIELYVEHLRLKYRLGENATLEMVAPRWFTGILRADLSKRLGVDMLSVTDAMIRGYLALRGVRVQFVVDWQDSFALAVPPVPPANGIFQPIGTGMGGPEMPLKWPSQVKLLLYPAGALFRMSADVITLDGIYDAASLARNEYTRLFTEEGIQVANRCYEPVVLTLTLCPNGLTGAGVERSCTPPSAPERSTSGQAERQPELAAAGTGSSSSSSSGSGSGSGSGSQARSRKS